MKAGRDKSSSPGTVGEERAHLRGMELDVADMRSARAFQDMTYGQALELCVSRGSERELLVFPHWRCRAGEFLREVNRLACGLLHLGVRPGDHVAAWLPNLPEYAVLEFALAKLGATLVPLNTRYRASELEYVLRQSEASVLLLTPQHGKLNFLETLLKVLPELTQQPAGRLSSAAFSNLTQVITLGKAVAGALSYEEVLQVGDRPELPDALRAREASVRPDDIAILQYTSGTTAFPKGVMLSQGQTLRNAFQMARRAGIGPEDRVLSAMPMFHVGGSVCALLGAVTMGYRLYLNPDFDPGETLRWIEAERITTYIGLEAMFLALRNHQDFSRHSRESLCRGWSAGTASVLRMVAEEIGIRHICSLYGLSEASPNVCITDWRDPYEKRIHTMGRPQPDVEVKILDPNSGQTVSRGQQGEICVRGWSVMKGYYRRPAETEQAIDADGWLHTGDRGLVDADGYLVWTGRLKDTIRVGGENVSTLEVENFLCSHPKVRAAAVVGVPDEKLTEVGLAFVQLKPGKRASEQEILDYCRERVAVFKVPRYVWFVESFEMTGSGKVQKYSMRERALKELGLTSPGWPSPS